jgi:hypothetical protein
MNNFRYPTIRFILDDIFIHFTYYDQNRWYIWMWVKEHKVKYLMFFLKQKYEY